MDATTNPTDGSVVDVLWDATVVGGGAAGLSAGVVLTRTQFATSVVDGGAPRNEPAGRMHRVPAVSADLLDVEGAS